MILTDRFVFMHVPKTGGTFVTRVLRDVLTPSKWDQRAHAVHRKYALRLPFYPYRYVEMPQHAMRKAIPPSYRHLPLVSCVRNPYDLYVSQYTFDWWRKNLSRWFADLGAIRSEFGTPESLDFPAFVRATVFHSLWARVCRREYPHLEQMGYGSTEWLHYHCLQPWDVVREAQTPSEMVGRASEAVNGVRFLHTRTLNQDLHAFLLEMGYPTQRIDPILTMGKIHPGPRRRPRSDHWSDYYDEDLRRFLRHHEALLFEVFPEFDDSFAPATVESRSE